MERLIEICLWSAYLVLSCAVFQAACWLLAFVRRERSVRVLENEYTRWLSYREDMLHHYYQAREENDQAMLESLKPRLIRVTKDLEGVQGEYAKMSNRKLKTA